LSINNKLYGYKLNFSNFVFHISMQTNYKKGGKRLFFCFSFFWQKGTYAYTETSSVFVSLCSEYRKRSTAYRSHGNLIPLWFSQSRPHCLIPRSRGAVTGRKYHYPPAFHCRSEKLFRILKLHIYRKRMASLADEILYQPQD
jgi:hypothetical protein